MPGCLSSIRIIILIPVPVIPAHIPKMKYSVPISLWFVEYSHRIVYDNWDCSHGNNS